MSATERTASQRPALEARDLVAGYTPEVDILRGLGLRLAEREIVTIVGPNGAGKSTLLKAVFGLLRPRSGTVLLHGREITGRRPHEIARAGMGYVPQTRNVFPNLTTGENLEMGGRSAAARERVEALFPILRDRARQPAGTLSGGERQMVAMARALMSEPEILLLDEPSAGLAPSMVAAVLDKVGEIRESGVAVLMVEQNARAALAISDRGYVLDLGQNRYEGLGADLLADPRMAELYLGGP